MIHLSTCVSSLCSTSARKRWLGIFKNSERTVENPSPPPPPPPPQKGTNTVCLKRNIGNCQEQTLYIFLWSGHARHSINLNLAESMKKLFQTTFTPYCKVTNFHVQLIFVLLQWRTQKGVWGFSPPPPRIFGFSGLKTHGFLSFEAPYPMYFSMVDATSSDRTILLLPPVVIAQLHVCSECIPTGTNSSRKEAGN